MLPTAAARLLTVIPSLIPVLPAVACLCLAAGCGGNGDGRVTVTGTVTLDGKPAEGGTIAFVNGVNRASARIQPDGTYSLSESASRGGIQPGTYQVGIQVTESPSKPVADEMVGPKPLSNPRYAEAPRSGLTAEVTKGGTNEFDFNVMPLIEGSNEVL